MAPEGSAEGSGGLCRLQHEHLHHLAEEIAGTRAQCQLLWDSRLHNVHQEVMKLGQDCIAEAFISISKASLLSE